MAIGSQRSLTDYAVYAGILVVAWVGYLCRFFIGSTKGVLILALAAYVSIPRWFGGRVLSPSELLYWFAEQSESVQLAVGAALLAAMGLVTAYWTAVAAWKTQRELDLQIAAALDMQGHFQVAQRCVIELGAYLWNLTESIREAGAAPDFETRRNRLAYANSQAGHFVQLRQQLHEARMTLNTLFGRHGPYLQNSWGTFDKLRAAVAMFDAAWESCQFSPPFAEFNNNQFPNLFVARYNPASRRTRGAGM